MINGFPVNEPFLDLESFEGVTFIDVGSKLRGRNSSLDDDQSEMFSAR